MWTVGEKQIGGAIKRQTVHRRWRHKAVGVELVWGAGRVAAAQSAVRTVWVGTVAAAAAVPQDRTLNTSARTSTALASVTGQLKTWRV